MTDEFETHFWGFSQHPFGRKRKVSQLDSPSKADKSKVTLSKHLPYSRRHRTASQSATLCSPSEIQEQLHLMRWTRARSSLALPPMVYGDSGVGLRDGGRGSGRSQEQLIPGRKQTGCWEVPDSISSRA